MPDDKRKPKRLSDKVVEEIKRGILFGNTGYKRPPKEHQFKKGQSGNPKGRPKMSTIKGEDNLDALVLKEAKRTVTAREGDEVKEFTALEAVLRALYATAIKGNAYAQKYIVERSGRAERERTQQIQQSIDFWTLYIAEGREAIDEAERNGEEPPTLLPHPDDIVIDHNKGVRFVGPLVQGDLNQLDEACRIRDVLIMQDALDWREMGDPESGDPLDGPGTALLFAIMINRSAPARYKLSNDEFDFKLMRYQGVPKRELLKDVYRGWRALGVHHARGKVYPRMRVGKLTLELLFEVRQRMEDGRLDADNKTPEEIQAEIADLILERQQGRL